jgi:hypothetical protein
MSVSDPILDDSILYENDFTCDQEVSELETLKKI